MALSLQSEVGLAHEQGAKQHTFWEVPGVGLSDSLEDASWRAVWESELLRSMFDSLPGAVVLQLARTSRAVWEAALELIVSRLPTGGTHVQLFALLTAEERGAALQALPALEQALLFENFSAATWRSCESAQAQPSDQRLCDARGGASGSALGDEAVAGWFFGPGTFAPPRLERCLVAAGRRCGSPLSVWALKMANTDPLSDLDPSGLVWDFGRPVRPRFASFRCRPAATRLHRCGGTFALAEGLGSDKGPERPAVFIHFVCEPEGRFITALQGHWGDGDDSSVELGSWRDNEWCTVHIALDWARGLVTFRAWSDGFPEDRHDDSSTIQVPFKGSQGKGCRYLLLYNQTGDFEVSWTDLYVR